MRKSKFLTSVKEEGVHGHSITSDVHYLACRLDDKHGSLIIPVCQGLSGWHPFPQARQLHHSAWCHSPLDGNRFAIDLTEPAIVRLLFPLDYRCSLRGSAY